MSIFLGLFLRSLNGAVSRETIFCRIAVHTGAKHIKSLQKRDKRKIRVSKTSCKLWGIALAAELKRCGVAFLPKSAGGETVCLFANGPGYPVP